MSTTLSAKTDTPAMRAADDPLPASVQEARQQLGIVVDLIPEGNSNRPGTPLAATCITIHNTDNPDRGADARVHAAYQKGDDARARQVSWHFSVDDGSVYQSLPVNEVGWHAGSHEGNAVSIGIEICENEGIDQAAANDRAALLTAVQLQELDITPDGNVKQHHDWSGKDCPSLLRNPPSGWDDFLARVGEYYAGLQSGPGAENEHGRITQREIAAVSGRRAEDAGDWDFLNVTTDGNDLVVSDARATWFGGTDDPGDDGQTASGVNTREHPETRGCALPMDGFNHASTDGSPIPRLPWFTMVEVTNRETGASISVPLIDLGPSKFTRAGLDLTQPSFRALGGNLNSGSLQVDYRIVGGASGSQSASKSLSLRFSELRDRSPLVLPSLAGGPAAGSRSTAGSKPPITTAVPTVGPYTSVSQMPGYHAGMLVVKMRASAGPAMAAMATAFAAGPPAGARVEAGGPGMAHLTRLDRGGSIKRVVPLSRRAQPSAGPRRGMATMMAGATAAASVPPEKRDPHAGVVMLELHPGEDLESLRTALAADPSVEFVSRVPIRYLLVKNPKLRHPGAPGAADVPPDPSLPWNLVKIRWAEARALPGFREATSIKVAVLDTGVDVDHPALNGRVKGYTYTYPNVSAPAGPKDYIGHGTHVSGLIGAGTAGEHGIRGICECDLHVWKIFGDRPQFLSFPEGYAYLVDPIMYQQALAACLEEGVQVINLSIGGPGQPDHQERALFDQLLQAGVTIVAAMGNDRETGSPTSYPAAIPGVVAVGATDLEDRVAVFSNSGEHIALAAPGVAIWSTLPTYPGQTGYQAVVGANGQPQEGSALKREISYAAWSGTSMATPHVTAASALVLANKGPLTPAEVKARLQQSAVKVPEMGGAAFHPDYGAGRLDLLNLLD